VNPEPRERDWTLLVVATIAVAVVFGMVLYAITEAGK
jgi:hypothetical protein